MRYLLLVPLFLTTACAGAGWGNDPAAQFAHVTYDSEYTEEMLKAQSEACLRNTKFCDAFVEDTK